MYIYELYCMYNYICIYVQCFPVYYTHISELYCMYNYIIMYICPQCFPVHDNEKNERKKSIFNDCSIRIHTYKKMK